jgi:hypothetical protein
MTSGDQPAEALHSALEKAWASYALVRLRRTDPSWDDIDGYVVGMGAAWVLVAEFDDGFRPSGWAALRRADLAEVVVKEYPLAWRRALEHQGFWPPAAPVPSVALSDTRALIESARAVAPTMCLFDEADVADGLWVGEVAELEVDHLWLREILPSAEWDPELGHWLLDDITRISIADPYAQVLAAIVQEPEDPSN